MRKLNTVPLTATLAHTEVDEWGLPTTGADTAGPERGASGQQSRLPWRARVR